MARLSLPPQSSQSIIALRTYEYYYMGTMKFVPEHTVILVTQRVIRDALLRQVLCQSHVSIEVPPLYLLQVQ